MNIGTLIKRLYIRISRCYAKHLGDKPADSAYRFLCSLKFWKDNGYWPHIKNPRSFNEKIFHRMLFDRNPLWTLVSDKLCVREYVAHKLGTEYMIPLLWSGANPEDIPFEKLPKTFVIKTNHGCGYTIIVTDKNQLDKMGAIRELNVWLATNFTYSTFVGMAWAYKDIKPEILVEAFLEEKGKVPSDYKFFCFSGKAEYVQVSLDRFGDASEQILNRDFELIPLYNGVRIFPGKIERPQNYEDLIRVAESLARGFDFIRVDLYSVNGQIYFGELTCYPAGGLARFVPKDYDFIFGEKWKIKSPEAER